MNAISMTASHDASAADYRAEIDLTEPCSAGLTTRRVQDRTTDAVPEPVKRVRSVDALAQAMADSASGC